MSSIVLTSTNFEKFSLIEKLLLELNVSFKKIDDTESSEVVILSNDEKKSIEIGEEDFRNGDFFSSEDIRKMMRECVK